MKAEIEVEKVETTYTENWYNKNRIAILSISNDGTTLMKVKLQGSSPDFKFEILMDAEQLIQIGEIVKAMVK